MENKFTKGEWKSVYNGTYCDITTSEDDNTHSISSVHKNQYLSIGEEEMNANALLISKAPEMLSMLEKLTEKLISSTEYEANVKVYRNIVLESRQLIKEATEL